MSIAIRQATTADTSLWFELARTTLGDDHPNKSIYDPSWIEKELNPASGHQTWVAVDGNDLSASITILGPLSGGGNPVLNLGRNLFRPDSINDGSGAALIGKICELSDEQNKMVVVRVLSSDNPQQVLFEMMGFGCAGFQPLKHMHRSREGVLFYVRPAQGSVSHRLPLSESLAQVSELATATLANLQIPDLVSVKDGITGYPLKTEITFKDGTQKDFELWRGQCVSANPPKEISGSFNLGFGYMRAPGSVPLRAVLGQRDGNVVAGICFYLDELDRCVRIIDSFSTDDLSMGSMLHQAVKTAQTSLNAVYVEVDILSTAPRLLKSAEQLGFVPVAYLPAFHVKDTSFTDIVKMVKLNMSYSNENSNLTAMARGVMEIVDRSLQDQKMGVAIINLLRALPIFEGLGDGELRKIGRLFTQKLFRPGEKVFSKGDSGNEAFVIMRGQIDICLEDGAKPIAVIGNGQIFGEFAFLDGAARNANALAGQASILLVVQRSAFNDLVQREPHLGMVVMKNIAMDLSNKLRRANSALSAIKK